MNKLTFSSLGETVCSAVLPNGLTVIVVPRPGFAKRYAQLSVRYGSCDRSFSLNGEHHEVPAGVAHFLEHKMFDMPDGSNMLAELSAAGAQPNAFTSLDVTAYHFSCTDHFYENLERLFRLVTEPYFTAESVRKEQGIIGQEIRMGDDDAVMRGYFGLLGSLYAAHPVRDRVDGSTESIAEITPELLYTCHKAFYRADNMVLACVGDIDPAQVEELAGRLIPTPEGASPVRDAAPEETGIPAAPLFTASMPVSAPQFFLGAKLPPIGIGSGRMRRELLGELTLSFLVGESSPFYTRLYRDGLLNRSFFSEQLIAAGTVTALCGGESRDPEAVADAFLARIESARTQGFDEGRWERCRKAYYGDCLRLLGSAERLGRSLCSAHFAGYDFPEIFDTIPTLTAEDGAAFAIGAFDAAHLARSVISPAK